LASKNLRVNESEVGGVAEDFDPTSVLSNTKLTMDASDIKEPPIEEILMARTLWPESQKLYGHPYELFCLTASHKGDIAASACKSKQEDHAGIIIW
jgi:elongator complex protein 2